MELYPNWGVSFSVTMNGQIATLMSLVLLASCARSNRKTLVPSNGQQLRSSATDVAHSASQAALRDSATVSVTLDASDGRFSKRKVEFVYSDDDKRMFDALSHAARAGAEAVELPSTPRVWFPVSASRQREYDALARRVLALELSKNHIGRLFPRKSQIPILSSRTALTTKAFPRAFRKRIRLMTREDLHHLAATSDTRVAFVTLEFAIASDEASVNFVADYFGGGCVCRSIKRWSKTARGWRLAPNTGNLIICG